MMQDNIGGYAYKENMVSSMTWWRGFCLSQYGIFLFLKMFQRGLDMLQVLLKIFHILYVFSGVRTSAIASYFAW